MSTCHMEQCVFKYLSHGMQLLNRPLFQKRVN